MNNFFKISKNIGLKFAKKSRDLNPLHINEIYGHNSMYGENICHGVLVILNFLKNNKKLLRKNFSSLDINFENPVFYNKKILIKKINNNEYLLIQDKKKILKISYDLSKTKFNFKKKNLKKILKFKKNNFYFNFNIKLRKVETLLMLLSQYAGMIYPGKNSLINKICIKIENNKTNLNKIKIFSKKISPNYPIIENSLVYENYVIDFETTERTSLKIKIEKPNKKLIKTVKDIKENVLIIGAGSGIGYDMLNLLLNNKKIKIFATYYKNLIHFKKKGLSILRIDVNKDLKKINKIIKKNSPIIIYYFATCKISLVNNSSKKTEFIKYYLKFPEKILNANKLNDIKLFYPSTTFISENSKSFYSKIKLKAERKFKKFRNVSIYRIPEINTKQNLSILDRNLKNFRYYLNNNTNLQKKIFFIK